MWQTLENFLIYYYIKEANKIFIFSKKNYIFKRKFYIFKSLKANDFILFTNKLENNTESLTN